MPVPVVFLFREIQAAKDVGKVQVCEAFFLVFRFTGDLFKYVLPRPDFSLGRSAYSADTNEYRST